MPLTPERIRLVLTRVALFLGYVQMWAWLFYLPDMNREPGASQAINAAAILWPIALGYLFLYGVAYGIGVLWVSFLPDRSGDGSS